MKRFIVVIYFLLTELSIGLPADQLYWGYYKDWNAERLRDRVISLYVSDAPEERRLAATLVSMLGTDVGTASAVMATLLKDGNASVRREAIYACFDLTLEEMRPLLPLVKKLTVDHNYDVRKAAKTLYANKSEGLKRASERNKEF